MVRLVIMDACSSSDLDGGGIATPSRPSAIGYSFVPTFHLMTDVEDSRSGTSLSVHSSPVIRSSPAIMSYSFVPPFQLIQEVDSKPNTCDNSTKPTSPKDTSSMLMEKTFYKNISNTLPIKIKQISYNSDEMETPRNCTMSQMQRKVPKMHQDFDNWNKDIAKQVDHWMKHKPIQSGVLQSFTTQKVPLACNSQIVKRKKLQKKRLRLKDVDDAVTSKASTARGSESDYSVNSDTFRSKQPHKFRPSKAKSLHVDKNDVSVFGSIHNEIEFKKRYRRMFDLNKHLQFVNSTNGLMGKNILKKTHRLPPMKMQPENKPQKLECSELFAITTVQQSNDPSDITSSSSQNFLRSVENSDASDSGLGQSQLSSRELNPTLVKEIIDGEGYSSTWRTQKPSKPEVFKFGKLPKISNSEKDSHSEEKTNRDFVDTKSITKRLNDSLQRCASWVSDTDSVHGEYAEMREMKVTINIKYKADGKKDKRKKETDFSKSTEDLSMNLTPFDRAKHLKNIADEERCAAMFSE